ncbi:hypothetical protein ACPCBC_28540 [Streptomyces incarnatus]|uniref:hypothetical protein n=1 Tax=unclassified Streptomyces TaxID=2593676 RepID=UPI0011A795A1|nr:MULTISPECIES: hypothetical protein [Streptomyces]QHC29833.1 hypothetical protein GR129_14410 [Streptomyces sp. HF10]WKE71308.1 hypothetical protein QHG49_20925 [Streptomyces sp. WP-1]
MSARDPQDVGLKGDAELRKDLDATVRARRDLGEEYDSALVESFLEKVEQRLDGAVDRRVRRQVAEQQMAAARGTAGRRNPVDSWGERYGFALLTLVLAIPLSAIAGAGAGLAGMVVTWLGIVGVNAAQVIRVHPQLLSGRSRRSGRDV